MVAGQAGRHRRRDRKRRTVEPAGVASWQRRPRRIWRRSWSPAVRASRPTVARMVLDGKSYSIRRLTSGSSGWWHGCRCSPARHHALSGRGATHCGCRAATREGPVEAHRVQTSSTDVIQVISSCAQFDQSFAAVTNSTISEASTWNIQGWMFGAVGAWLEGGNAHHAQSVLPAHQVFPLHRRCHRRRIISCLVDHDFRTFHVLQSWRLASTNVDPVGSAGLIGIFRKRSGGGWRSGNQMVVARNQITLSAIETRVLVRPPSRPLGHGASACGPVSACRPWGRRLGTLAEGVRADASWERAISIASSKSVRRSTSSARSPKTRRASAVRQGARRDATCTLHRIARRRAGHALRGRSGRTVLFRRLLAFSNHRWAAWTTARFVSLPSPRRTRVQNVRSTLRRHEDQLFLIEGVLA